MTRGQELLTGLHETVNAQTEVIRIQSGVIDSLFRLLMQHVEASEVADIVGEINRAAALLAKIEE